ncbi:MAG: hypothetical protein IPI65_12630 [Bacteroidetes bacterium]|nr:hypothetical protein [Bacteroidota bacterium]
MRGKHVLLQIDIDYFSDAIKTSKNQIACTAKFGGTDGFMSGQDSMPYPGTLMLFDSTANLLWLKIMEV